MNMYSSANALLIGWAELEITPHQLPVEIAGQLYSRVSEGVKDPLLATACALSRNGEHVVFVSCDLVSITERLYQAVRQQVSSALSPEVDPSKIILHATHTHTGPETRDPAQGYDDPTLATSSGIDLGAVTPVEDTVVWLAGQIYTVIAEAWSRRAPGSIAYGLDDAVIGRNRRWVDDKSSSTMYRLHRFEDKERFRHIEGYEDHSLNLLATYDTTRQLTGVIINLPCPSQEEEGGFLLSADFWHETRQELRTRHNRKLFILPQVSAAGEQTSHPIFEKKARDRMLELRQHSARQEIALRITHAVERILPVISAVQESTPIFKHVTASLPLPMNQITASDLAAAMEESDKLRIAYHAELEKLEHNPALKQEQRWYVKVTAAYRRMKWYQGVVQRYKQQNQHPTFSTEVHTIRLGDIAFATNPFEYYLDFGIQIKVRSPAIQTFIVQLAGSGSYVPSPRSVLGGGYGSIPASNPVGSEGGQVLADYTIDSLRQLFAVSS